MQIAECKELDNCASRPDTISFYNLHFAICILQFPVSILLLTCSLIRADETSLPVFNLHTGDGIIGAGSLAELREDWGISLTASKAIEVSGRDLVALRRTKTALPPTPREAHVLLTNGDRLPGTTLDLSGERIRFKAGVGTDQEVTLPLSAITLFWFASPDGVEAGDVLRQRLAAEHRTRDVVLLRNGDMVEGTLTALNTEMVQINQANGKQIKVARDNKIAALALSTQLARSLQTKGSYGRLVLANGGRLSLLSARADRQVLVAKTAFGATVSVPVNQILALDLRQGRAVYLSDLKPCRYEHTPYLGVHWPFTFDTSVAGNEMRVDGSTYDKGIGMHSQSRLTFELAGRYQWFEAYVGLDDRTGREGSVQVQVLVDGKPQELGAAKELTGRDKPLSIRIRVAGARELTLVVLFGQHGDVQDHVDWADARLIK